MKLNSIKAIPCKKTHNSLLKLLCVPITDTFDLEQMVQAFGVAGVPLRCGASSDSLPWFLRLRRHLARIVQKTWGAWRGCDHNRGGHPGVDEKCPLHLTLEYLNRIISLLVTSTCSNRHIHLELSERCCHPSATGSRTKPRDISELVFKLVDLSQEMRLEVLEVWWRMLANQQHKVCRLRFSICTFY